MDNTYKVFRQIQEKGKQYSQFDNFDREDLIEELIEKKRINENDLKEIDNLKQKIEKAVEYIENELQISILPNNQIINGTEVVKRINKIINILKGDDTNE